MESHAKLHGKNLRRFEGNLPKIDEDSPPSKKNRNFNSIHANNSRLVAKECYKYYCPKCSFSCGLVGSFLKHTAMHGRRANAPFMCNIVSVHLKKNHFAIFLTEDDRSRDSQKKAKEAEGVEGQMPPSCAIS